MKQLIEDYKRRLDNVNNLISESNFSGSINDIRTKERLTTKAAEYRTFISELEKVERLIQSDSDTVKNDADEQPVKLWNVPVMRTAYSHNLIAVSARTEEEAIELALDQAGSEEFSEKSAEYEAPDGAHLID